MVGVDQIYWPIYGHVFGETLPESTWARPLPLSSIQASPLRQLRRYQLLKPGFLSYRYYSLKAGSQACVDSMGL